MLSVLNPGWRASKTTRMEGVSCLSASFPVSPAAETVTTSATARKRVQFLSKHKRNKEDSAVRHPANIMVVPFRHSILV
jgi:hypothetical protein